MKAKSQAILADTGTLQSREGRSSWRAEMLIEAAAFIETFPHAGRGVNRRARVAPDWTVPLDVEDAVSMFKSSGESDLRSSRGQVA